MPVISIFIVDDIMFPELSGYHQCFHMREAKQGQVFCDDMEIHLIELPKFKKLLPDLADGFDQWLYLIRYSENLDPLSPPAELSLPEVVQTLKRLEIMAHTEQERLRYEAHERHFLSNFGTASGRYGSERKDIRRGFKKVDSRPCRNRGKN